MIINVIVFLFILCGSLYLIWLLLKIILKIRILACYICRRYCRYTLLELIILFNYTIWIDSILIINLISHWRVIWICLWGDKLFLQLLWWFYSLLLLLLLLLYLCWLLSMWHVIWYNSCSDDFWLILFRLRCKIFWDRWKWSYVFFFRSFFNGIFSLS